MRKGLRPIAMLATLTVSGPPVMAVTPVAPVGIETCDEFLAAYAQCAASPDVPDVARTGLRQSINTMREGFRAAVAGNERARRTVEFQCAQAHGVVRERLMAAYRCDFPAPSAAAAALAAQAPIPKSGSRP